MIESSKVDFTNNKIVEGHLDIEEFESLYKVGKLGRIYFPNGKKEDASVEGYGESIKNYFVHLRDLYNAISEWNIADKSVLSLGLVGIVAMGDTVVQPGYKLANIPEKNGWKFKNWKVQRKYIDFEKKVPIQPREAEFLVVTQDNPVPLDYVSRRTTHIASCVTKPRKDIQLYVRGIEQVLKGLERGRRLSVDTDEVTMNAFEKGVPIFFNHELKYIIETTGVENYNSHYAEWSSEEHDIIKAIIR
jgi:hypothetical protein